MAKLDEARIKSLLAKGKYKDAGVLLDSYLLEDRNNAVAWYLVGILAMKLKNYELAHEHFERALTVKRLPECLLFDGLAYMEMLEIEPAKAKFGEYLAVNPNDAEANFYMAICYLLQGNPLSGQYIKKAHTVDKEKTLRLLRDFFREVIESNPAYDSTIKEQLKKKLG
ncbi:MAG: tetratricopeptide repeat protein [Candidatus Micrarchaeota archaeon]